MFKRACSTVGPTILGMLFMAVGTLCVDAGAVWTTPVAGSTWSSANFLDFVGGSAQALDIAIGVDGSAHWVYMRVAQQQNSTTVVQTSEVHYANDLGQDTIVASAQETILLGTVPSFSGSYIGKPTLFLRSGAVYVAYLESAPESQSNNYTTSVKLAVKAQGESAFSATPAGASSWVSLTDDAAADIQSLDMVVDSAGIAHWTYLRTTEAQAQNQYTKTTTIRYGNNGTPAVDSEIVSGTYTEAAKSAQQIEAGISGVLLGQPTLALVGSTLYLAYLRSTPDITGQTFTNTVMLAMTSGTAFTAPAAVGQEWTSDIADCATGSNQIASSQTLDLAVETSGTAHWMYRRTTGSQTANSFALRSAIHYGNSLGVEERIQQAWFNGPLPPAPPFSGSILGKPALALSSTGILKAAYLQTDVTNSDGSTRIMFTETALDGYRCALTLQRSPSGGGTIDATPGPDAVDGKYAKDAAVNLVAVASPGYVFSSWQGVDTQNDNTATVTMDTNRTVTAVFTSTATPRYTLTTQAANGSVAATPEPGQDGHYDKDQVVALEATPSPGYQFVSWDGVDSHNGTTASVTMTDNRTVTANFSQIPPDRFVLTLQASPPAGGTINPVPAADQDGKYSKNQQVNLQAAANAGYQFVSWQGVDFQNGPTATVIMSSDRTVTAVFMPLEQGRYSLTVDSAPVSGGTVNRSQAPDQDNMYESGTNVVLTAAPAALYKFDFWENVDAYSGKTASVLINTNRTVTAHFKSYRDASDVNGDRYCDAMDVQFVINAALRLSQGVDCDIDGSGSVDALDVQLAINAALRLL